MMARRRVVEPPVAGEATARRTGEAGSPVPVTREDPMLLVPRQLARAGMTGDVPYYGGRFTPAQAYAAARPRPPRAGPLAALQELLDAGVLSEAEYRRFRARVTG
jgi:hypothetical protein